ncbi:MAG TPA: DUF1559 domain-containing protein [Pirellulales bacterium]|jgi:prepilin-type N-terminal cleavage/methylation domain-containing protein|nr:DUF1559 domain-containing protein [Pirellulales bacterium]
MTYRQRGFTLVELLVCIAILGIIFALLLPALQATREAGRRSACANNLLRIALATASYESAYGYYPPGVTDLKGPILSRARGLHHGWIERLLPYLDERLAYEKIDFTTSVYDPKNAAVRNLRLPELICPSDTVIDDGPHSSYAACQNDTESLIDADNRGVFFLNSQLRPKDITDGLAYTLFVAEKQSEGNGTDLGWTSGTRATLRNTGTDLNRTGPRALVSQSFVAGPPPDPANPTESLVPPSTELPPARFRMSPYGEGPVPIVAGDQPPLTPVADFPPAMPVTIERPTTPEPIALREDGTPILPPPPKPKHPPVWELPNYVGGFGSDHSGGIVVAALGDGSVRYLLETIDPSCLKLLGNRADGHVIDLKELEK